MICHTDYDITAAAYYAATPILMLLRCFSLRYAIFCRHAAMAALYAIIFTLLMLRRCRVTPLLLR